MILLKRKYLFLIIWLGLIAYASLSPSKNFPEIILFPHIDKLFHISMYLGLSFFIIPAYLKQHCYLNSYLFSLFISSLSGIILELLQKYITQDRSASLFDILANIVGSIIGIMLYKLLIERKKIEYLLFKIQ